MPRLYLVADLLTDSHKGKDPIHINCLYQNLSNLYLGGFDIDL